MDRSRRDELPRTIGGKRVGESENIPRSPERGEWFTQATPPVSLTEGTAERAVTSFSSGPSLASFCVYPAGDRVWSYLWRSLYFNSGPAREFSLGPSGSEGGRRDGRDGRVRDRPNVRKGSLRAPARWGRRPGSRFRRTKRGGFTTAWLSREPPKGWGHRRGGLAGNPEAVRR